MNYDLAGISIKYDAASDSYLDVKGNKVSEKLLSNVLIYDTLTGTYFDAKGKQVDTEEVALSLIFDPDYETYKDPDGYMANPATIDVEELIAADVLSDDVYIATSSDDGEDSTMDFKE